MVFMKKTVRLAAALTAVLMLTGCTASIREASTHLTHQEACQELVGGEDSLGYRAARWVKSTHEAEMLEDSHYQQGTALAAEGDELAEVVPPHLTELVMDLQFEAQIVAEEARTGVPMYSLDPRTTWMAAGDIADICLEGDDHSQFLEVHYELITGDRLPES